MAYANCESCLKAGNSCNEDQKVIEWPNPSRTTTNCQQCLIVREYCVDEDKLGIWHSRSHDQVEGLFQWWGGCDRIGCKNMRMGHPECDCRCDIAGCWMGCNEVIGSFECGCVRRTTQSALTRTRSSPRLLPGLPLLHTAAVHLSALQIRQCLEFGSGPNYAQNTADPHSFPRTPLGCLLHGVERACDDLYSMRCIRRHFNECLDILVRAGADINRGEWAGGTLLHDAAICQLPSWVARSLRKNGCDVHALDDGGFRAEDKAAQLVWQWAYDT